MLAFATMLHFLSTPRPNRRRLPLLVRLPLLMLVPLLLCCDPETPVACVSDEDPVVQIGQGVGGAFVELEDEDEVMLATAPQGGFGVPIVLQTQNLAAGDFTNARVLLEAVRGGTVEGTFETGARLFCRSDGAGGSVSGIVVGLDPAVYGSNDDLLALDGELLDLQVTVTDEEGRQASAVRTVTVRVGG